MNTDAEKLAAYPKLVEAIQNMLGAFDNPARRLKYKSDFADTTISIAKKALDDAKEPHYLEFN